MLGKTTPGTDFTRKQSVLFRLNLKWMVHILNTAQTHSSRHSVTNTAMNHLFMKHCENYLKELWNNTNLYDGPSWYHNRRTKESDIKQYYQWHTAARNWTEFKQHHEKCWNNIEMRDKKRTVQPIGRLGQCDDVCSIANQWTRYINMWNYYYMDGHHTGRLLLSLQVGRLLEIFLPF